MPITNPPITGDAQLDSWTLQLTDMINRGILPGVPTTSAGGGGGGGPGMDGRDGAAGNTRLQLFQRTTTDTAPMNPTNVTYDVQSTPATATADNGWSIDGSTSTGDYVWATYRYVADLTGTITDQASWNTPLQVGTPGEDAISYDIDIDGFDFIKATNPNVTLNTVAYRIEGETTTDITSQLATHNVFWIRTSVNSALDETVPVYSSTTNYNAGDIVRFTDTLGSGQSIELNFIALQANINSQPDASQATADWQLTAPSSRRFRDAQYNFPTTATTEVGRRRRGLSITVTSMDVMDQARFRALLNNDLGALP